MTEVFYDTLIGQFCELAGLDGAERIRRTGALLVDGLAVGLSCSPTYEAITLSVDLGPVGPAGEWDVYRKLLELNLVVSRARIGSIGIEASSGRAVFDVSMPLGPDTTASDLADKLDHAVGQAEYIRQNILEAAR